MYSQRPGRKNIHSMRRDCHVLRRRMRGAVMVETTIVLPVLLLLLFSTAEIGSIFYHYNTLTKSLREGARYLSTDAFTGDVAVVDLTPQRIAATRNYVLYGHPNGGPDPVLDHLAPGDITVTGNGGSSVTVGAAYNYVPVFGPVIQSFGFGSGVNISLPLNAAVTMRAIN